MANSLPAEALVLPPDRFVGREDEVARLDALLGGEARLLVLLGPPGVGKTRLALEYAGQRGKARFDGVWASELRGVEGAEELCRAVGEALEVPLGQAKTAKEAIRKLGLALGARGRVLLVLDGVERLGDAAWGALNAWQAEAKGLALLVTSNERPHAAGEALFDVGPLATEGGEGEEPAGVRLFLERARASGQDAAPGPGELEAVREIVRELDGLPFAIELAAARVRMMTPAQILEKLRGGQPVLGEGARRLGGGRRSLADTMAWAWDSLGVDERRALAQSAVFRGGFSLAAAERVLAPGEQALDVLESLRDRSLIRAYRDQARGREPRFDLYVMVREFAVRKLAESGDAPEVEERHAAYYLGEARRGALSHLDIGNLTAIHRRALGAPRRPAEALQAAIALAPLLTPTLPARPLLVVLDEALALGEEAAEPPALQAEARLARSEACLVRSLHDEGEADARLALDLAERAGDSSQGLKARLLAALHRGLAGGVAAAYGQLSAAAEQARARGERAVEARALGNLGLFDMLLGQYALARGRFEQVPAMYSALGDQRGAAIGVHNLGSLLLTEGHVDEAIRKLRQSLPSFEAMGLRMHAAQTHFYLALAHAERDELEQASDEVERALSIYRRLGDGTHTSGSLMLRAQLRAASDEPELARQALDEARAGAPEELRALLELTEGHIDLALARRAARAGDGAEAHRARGAALQRVGRAFSPPPPPSVHSLITPVALRSLQRMLAEPAPAAVPSSTLPSQGASASSRPPRPPLRLLVSLDGRAFQPPGGEWVDFQRRAAPRLMLLRLIAQRRQAPGASLSLEELQATGWPGQALQTEAGRSRVYVALSTLRKHGLAALLKTRDDGYLLDPEVEIVEVDRPGDEGDEPAQG